MKSRKATKQDVTQKEVRHRLHYNSDTGIFTWLVSNSNRIKVGAIAGYTKKEGYLVITIKYKSYYLHRLAFLYMTGEFPDEVDHINHIRTDNR